MAQLRKHPFDAGPDPGTEAGIGDPGLRLPSLRVVEAPQPGGMVPSLTRRERECLGWCAEGKSYWETAVILGISERTVSFHMEAVRAKLIAASNAHAVAIAARAGLFEAASRAFTPRRGLR
jgi:LuxR family transcriptional regulator, quorum-sensing system regulator SinR